MYITIVYLLILVYTYFSCYSIFNMFSILCSVLLLFKILLYFFCAALYQCRDAFHTLWSMVLTHRPWPSMRSTVLSHTAVSLGITSLPVTPPAHVKQTAHGTEHYLLVQVSSFNKQIKVLYLQVKLWKIPAQKICSYSQSVYLNS